MSQLFGNGAASSRRWPAPGGYLDEAQRKLIQKTVLAQCGGEAFIRDPAACRFDPGKLHVQGGPVRRLPDRAAGRRRPARSMTAAAIRGPARSPSRASAPGARGAKAAAGNAWITGPTQDKHASAAGYQFSSNAFKYFAFQDPTFDFLKLDLGAQFDRAAGDHGPDDRLGRIRTSAAFRKRGGKLIQYHGWNDPAIPARSSIRYYEDVRPHDGRDRRLLPALPGARHAPLRRRPGPRHGGLAGDARPLGGREGRARRADRHRAPAARRSCSAPIRRWRGRTARAAGACRAKRK